MLKIRCTEYGSYFDQWASDLIQYLEWPEPKKEDEFFNEITLIQSNYISDNPTQNLF